MLASPLSLQRIWAVLLWHALTGLLLVGARGQESRALADSGVGSAPVIGLAHVDLMDLHLERRPDGSVAAREVLAEKELEARYDAALDSGAAWNRWSLYWDLVERDSGFDWSVADGIVSRDVRSGLRSLVILQGTPGRYATGGSVSTAMPSVGGSLPGRLRSSDDGRVSAQASPPVSLSEDIFRRADGSTTDDPEAAAAANPANPWAVFVAAAVDRYRPGGRLAEVEDWSPGKGVSAWEIGNEPNLEHFWSGTAEEYLRYLEVASLVIRWLDPEAVVLHGGIADGANAEDWYSSFLAALCRRASRSPLPERYGYYFDASAWHWYTYPSQLHTGPIRAAALLSEHGLPPKPLWVTESGVPIWSEYPGPCWDPTSPWRASVPEQSAYIWQSLAEALASDVAALFHFQLYDDCGNGPTSYDAFGLVRNPTSNQCWRPPEGRDCWRLEPEVAGTARPGLEALREAGRELDATELLWRPARSSEMWQRVLYYRPPDTRVTMVWNWRRAAQSIELWATGGEAETVALAESGRVVRRTVRPESGRLGILLPGATNRNNPGNQAPVIAGRPVMVIERDTAPPFRSEVADLPELSARSIDLEIQAADGGTGVAAYRLYFSPEPPGSLDDWRSLGEPVPWPDSPLSGTARFHYNGESGGAAYFAAQAVDRAGNWSELPVEYQAWTRIEAGPGTPRLTAAPSASPAQPFATPTPTPPRTVREPTQTPAAGATDGRSYLPATLRQPAKSGTATATPRARRTAALATPTRADATASPCALFTVKLRGPRGGLLSGAGARWWLRAYDATQDEYRTFEVEPGASVCVDPPPDRAVAWAAAPGYVSYPPQDMALSDELYLSTAPNRLINGSFEAGLAGWQLDGSHPPQPSSLALSGAGAARLGPPQEGGAVSAEEGTSTMSQEVLVPADGATLSFRALLDLRPNCDRDGCRELDRFEVMVIELEDPVRRTSYLTGRDGVTAATDGWDHLWFDLSVWSGQRIRVALNLQQADAADPSSALIDNMAVGRLSRGVSSTAGEDTWD